MPESFDLAIAGAGPAGAAAAIHAARAGLRVLLAERRARPARAPGETLHPGSEAILNQLGVGAAARGAGFRRHSGIWIQWDGPRRFEPYGGDEAGPWLGFQAERPRLEQLLLEAAAEAGAEIRRGVAVGPPLLTRGRIEGFFLDGRPVRARWTIDSTGRRSWLARELKLPECVRSPPIFVRFGWDGVSAPGGEPELTATDGGWQWRAPLAAGRRAWVSAEIGPAAAKRGSGADLSWRMRRAALPGALLAGDAAVTLDPCSSRGILRALMTGIMAADLAAGEIGGRLRGGEAVEGYGRWLRDWFEADVAALADLYRRHPSERVARSFAA
jgi:flavin-dependent dehydrogenase